MSNIHSEATKNQVMNFYEQMRLFHNDNQDAFYVAMNLAYLARNVETTIPLDTLYQLSVRLQEVPGIHILLNEERLDGVRALLDYGMAPEDESGLEPVSPEDMPAFLLSCSDDTFMYTVEQAACISLDIYEAEEHSYTDAINQDQFFKDLKIFQTNEKKPSLDEKISDAHARTAAVEPSPIKEHEPEI